MATVTMSIGSKRLGMTIDTVNAGPPWNLELTIPTDLSNVNVGDFVVDSVGRIYNITIVDDGDDELTVGNDYSTSTPTAGAGIAGRAFSGLGAWEAALSTFHGAGDTAVAEAYNDTHISEPIVTINEDVVGSGGTIKLTVAAGERHNGRAGTGFRWSPTANGVGIKFIVSTNTPKFILEWLEIIGRTGTTGFTTGININKSKGTLGNCIVRNLIVRGFAAASGTHEIYGIYVLAADVELHNCIIYDIDASGTSGPGHAINTSAAADSLGVLSCTVDNVSNAGIRVVSGALSVEPINCAVTNCGTAFEMLDAGGWGPATSNNATDEAAVPGTSGLTLLDPNDLFVRRIAGAEDYHLRPTEGDSDTGSPLTWAGIDLSGTFTDDIDGVTRPATWSIGADAGIFPTITGQSTRRTGNVTQVIAQGYLTPPPGTDPPIYHWFRDGAHVAETHSRAYTFVLADDNQADVTVQVATDPAFDPVANAPAAFPATRTIEWLRSLATDLDHYRVEQKIGAGSWIAVARVPRNAEAWAYRWQSDRLTDLTDHEWRVFPVDAAGNDGTALALAAEQIVRTPDAPNFTVAFDPSPDTVEFAAA